MEDQKPPINFDDETLLFTPLQSIEHLQAWCDKFLGFTLPDCPVTEWATSTPAQFVYEIYRAVMDGKPLNILAISGRDSSKTVALSVADLLVMLHDLRGGLHAAMTKTQASRARDYLQSYIYKIPQLRAALVKENTSLIQLNIRGHNVGLELISLTPKAVQGAHESWVSVDELASSMDPSQIKAYKDLSGIPGTHKLNGKPAVVVKITSRQTGNSLAEQEIKNANKSGVKIVIWTTLDSMQKCTPDRHGTEIVPMNINTIKGLAYTDEEFTMLTGQERSEFVRTTETTDGCIKCPLLNFCKGRAKLQTSTSPLLRSIDDVIGKVNSSASTEWVNSQLLSLQPSSEGMVYPEFNPEIHMPTWDSLWTKLTGEIPSIVVNRAAFVKELKRRGAAIYAGTDWGFTNPATCVVIAVDKKDQIFILEAAAAVRKNDPDWTEYIATVIHPKYDVQMYCPDAENPSGIDIMKKRGLPVAQIDKGAGSVRKGINVIKGLLRVPGTNNMARLFICPDIKPQVVNHPGLVEEFGMYAYDIDIGGAIRDDKNPAKGADHHLDALRYVLYWLYGKVQMTANFANVDQTLPYNPLPSAEDLARMQGITFNDNRHEFFDIGIQPNSSNKPDDDDPNGGTSGGLSVAWT